jgi:toxin ParE1/3/4
MGEVRLRPRAQVDLDEIWSYTETRWGPFQARRYATELREVCLELATNPGLGRELHEVHPGLRVYPAGRHLIFYLMMPDGIDVVRILHERMDVTRHLT